MAHLGVSESVRIVRCFCARTRGTTPPRQESIIGLEWSALGLRSVGTISLGPKSREIQFLSALNPGSRKCK